MANETEWLKIGLEIIGMASGAAAVIFTLKSDVKAITGRMDKIEADMKSNTTKLDGLSQLFIQFARFDERFTNLASQYTLLQQRVEEMAHGEGFVVPFKPPER